MREITPAAHRLRLRLMLAATLVVGAVASVTPAAALAVPQDPIPCRTSV